MDIGGWLRSLGLGQYEAAFRENEIDDTILSSLTAEDLKDLGVRIVGHRRKLLTAIAALRAEASTKAPLPDALPAADRSTKNTAERRQVTVLFSDLVGWTALCAGALLAIEGVVSPGAMLASSVVLARALAPVEQLIFQWKRLVACRAAYARLHQVFELHPPAAATADLPSPDGRIEVESAVVFPPLGQRPVVKYVSFSLQPGECVAVLGASGSGKSSLARALAGVWPLADGSIRIDGATYAQWDATKLGKHIGYLPQDVDLFTGTIAENIARLDCGNQQGVVAAAQLAGVHEAILRLPKGYDTRLGDGEVALSGGMRQRIGLARALYGNPRLIVLDEPNSNLDEEGERALANAIEKLKADKRTIVVITHRPAALANADRVMIMSLGQVVAIGPRDELLAKARGGLVAVVNNSSNREAKAA